MTSHHAKRSPGQGATESNNRLDWRYSNTTVPNDPPEDHHDDGWWAQLVAEVESGLITEADQ